ncbi:hybrid sensor histidine kinase/response regulator [Roseicitreum antarcticum]|nr:ATP-binding protein [Roseicitreum antarcticum]
MLDLTNEARLTRIQGLVVDVLNNLLRAPIDDIDTQIDQALARIATFCKRDRAYVFEVTGDMTQNTHEWCAQGIEPVIDQLQELPLEAYGPLGPRLQAGEVLHLPDVHELPEGSVERETLEMQGIRSLLIVPMLPDGKLTGFVGFDGVEVAGEFLPGEIYLLRSVTDVVNSVLRRRESTRAVASAQAALTAQSAFLESILTTGALGICVYDATGTAIYINDMGERVLGVTSDELLGRKHDDPRWRFTNINMKPVPEDELPFNVVMRTGRTVENIRWALHCPEGLRYMSLNAAPVLDADGEITRVVWAMNDITQVMQSELAREAAFEEARRANTAKSQFLAKMSHEMRTPLNGVLGIAEVLDDIISDPDQKRMVGILHDSGGLLMSIINDLLDMSKIEADSLDLESVPFSVSDLAQRVEMVHTLKASDKQLSFSVTTGPGCGTARMGDSHRILQILHNVISNAIKFTSAGRVDVAFEAPLGGDVIIRVTDTGIGMSPPELAGVFEEFSQADSSISRKYGGTGLGMAIVKRLVGMMHGEVTLSSTKGVGTQVLITLPLPMAQDTPLAVSETTSGQRNELLRGMRILAADDNRTNRMILGAMLAQLGASAVMVEDGHAALARFTAGTFDLVILDISMPGMDGVEVLQAIRAREASLGLQRTSVVAFTANAMSHQVQSYLEAGFDDCLTKPLKTERLNEALTTVARQMMQRDRTGHAHVISTSG